MPPQSCGSSTYRRTLCAVLKKLHLEILLFMRYRVLVLGTIFGLIISSLHGQIASQEKCIEDLVFNATLEFNPSKIRIFTKIYVTSLLCFPILFSEKSDKIIISKNGNRFRNFSYQDLQGIKITNYIEVQRFEITVNSAYLELFNRLENMYVISRFKIFDCKIIGGKTNIYEL